MQIDETRKSHPDWDNSDPERLIWHTSAYLWTLAVKSLDACFLSKEGQKSTRWEEGEEEWGGEERRQPIIKIYYAGKSIFNKKEKINKNHSTIVSLELCI